MDNASECRQARHGVSPRRRRTFYNGVCKVQNNKVTLRDREDRIKEIVRQKDFQQRQQNLWRVILVVLILRKAFTFFQVDDWLLNSEDCSSEEYRLKKKESENVIVTQGETLPTVTMLNNDDKFKGLIPLCQIKREILSSVKKRRAEHKPTYK
uniref:Uncharacterized protein n=1 Tax=Glossina pallidipes TaxID=7398 RepID=A0A1A9ZNC7_GLOPL